MNDLSLTQTIQRHLLKICNEFGNRHVGSPGNRQATDYAKTVLQSVGFEIRTEPFNCMEWQSEGVTLKAGGQSWSALVNPYSLPFSGEGEMVAVSTLDELAIADIAGRIVLLHGEIAREQVMPKSFVFYNPKHHQRLVSLLEAANPAALICATGKNPDMAGSVYPFPLFEDGDFDIPSVTITDVDGVGLLEHVGSTVCLSFDSRRIRATGTNVIASKGRSGIPSIVLCAHIDAKKNTPGALDNGTGVATLLGVAELLADYQGERRIELALLNGEDYYAVPGQMQYLEDLGEGIRELDLVINLDAAGHHASTPAYSFYGCSELVRNTGEKVFSNHQPLAEGDAWVQSDHTMFVMAGCAAIAFTSSNFEWLCREITHTPKDSTDLVDCQQLSAIARALRELLSQLDAQ
jgi:aminopeptidase YwaD